MRDRLFRFSKGLLRFAAVVLVAVAIASSLLLISQRVLNPFHVVASNSMYPQIRTGDAVLIKDVKPEEVRVGQVILFQDPKKNGDYVIHRVVGIEEANKCRFFTTKGDNNPVADPQKVPTGELVGGVGVKLPRFGKFLNFLTTPKGYISCIAVPAGISLLLVICLSIIEKASKIRARRQSLPQPTAE